MEESSYILREQGMGSILVLLSAILLSTFFMGIKPANGALIDLANRTLAELDKKMTYSMLSIALTQLNNS